MSENRRPEMGDYVRVKFRGGKFEPGTICEVVDVDRYPNSRWPIGVRAIAASFNGEWACYTASELEVMEKE